MPSARVVERKNKNGINHMVVWEMMVNGRRTYGSESCGPSEDYAYERKKEILDALYTGRPIERRIKIIPFKDFAKEYLKNSKATKDEGTYKNFDARAVIPFSIWCKTPVSMISKNDIYNWRDHLIQEGYAPHTVHMRLRGLSTALSFAKEKGYINKNPFSELGRKANLFPRLKVAGRYLTETEIEKILPSLPLRQAQAFYFVLQTGLRHDELLGLDWKVVQRPQNGVWSMEITRASNYGLGDRETKTRNSRFVRINQNAVDVMGKPQIEGNVFPWKTQVGLMRPLREATKDLNLGRVRVHDGRHTWATNYMYRTGNIFQLFYEGGWESMDSAKVYQHIRELDEPVELKPFPYYFRTNRTIRVA